MAIRHNKSFSVSQLLGFFMFLSFFIFLSFSILFLAAFFLNKNIVFSQDNKIEIPEILPRSAWFSDNLKGLSDWQPERDSFPPDYRKIDRIVVHHSAGTNDIPNPIATIQSIYRYHAVTKGWNDIGYNYIIDREGRIYEGRQGGNGVRGAHVYARSDCMNFNYGSIGIVFLGNYSTEQPPEAMYQSAAKLIGWLADVNGLDPAQTARYSMVWQDGRSASGTCDSSVGGFTQHQNFGAGFTYNYYGPVLIGHRDVDSTACPGIIDLIRLRKEAGGYAKQISNIKYQISSMSPPNGGPACNDVATSGRGAGGGGLSEIFEIQDGQAKSIINDQLSMINSSDIVEISQSQLSLFLNNSYKYSDGNLLRFGSEPSVYVVKDGKIREFESMDALKKLGFDAGKVISLAKTDKELYSPGNPVKYGPDGKLFAEDGTVYYIEGGKKRGITSPKLFENYGFSWKAVAPAGSDFGRYLSGDLLRYKEGSLLSIGPAVFAYESGELCGITSEVLFKVLGYVWKNVIPIVQSEADLYKIGSIKKYPDNTLIAAKENLTVFRLQAGNRQGFASAEIFINLGYKWDKIIKTSSSELNLYPYEGEVRYPDGFVLRQDKDAAVYIIEGGKKRPFSSAQEFLSSGKKWSDVVVLKSNDLDSYALAVNNSLVENCRGAALCPPSSEKVEEIQETGSSSSDKMASLIAPISESQKSKVESPKSGEETGNQINKNQESVKDTSENQISQSANLQIPQFIRVALKSFSKNIAVTSAGGGYTVKDLGGNVLYNGSEGNVYTAVFSESADLLFSGASDSVIMKIYSIDDVLVDAANPFHSGYGGASDNVFKGNIRIKYSPVSKTCWAVNELALQDYIKGVAEVSEDMPIEYLKAMSVIIRTYISHHASNGGKHAGEPFDLKNSLNGNGDDQVYKGYGFTQRAPVFSSLADFTKGQIITYKNSAGEEKPIVAAYSSDSGGTSKDARILWGSSFNDKPYLFGGIKDPDSTIHNAYSVSISHGAGLSAAGAKEMARLGSDYISIIKYYYIGVEILSF